MFIANFSRLIQFIYKMKRYRFKNRLAQFERKGDNIRLPVRDRCDFRIVYGMPVCRHTVPSYPLLTISEIHQIAKTYVDLCFIRINSNGILLRHMSITGG